MSRTGDRREILRGPFYYGIVFVAITIIFWKDSMIGVIALMMMCGGDGLADIIGNNIKSRPIPWSKNKTLAGSISVFFGGLFLSMAVIGIYNIWGMTTMPIANYIIPVTIISAIGALVESLPFKDIDNITLPLAAVLLGLLLNL